MSAKRISKAPNSMVVTGGDMVILLYDFLGTQHLQVRYDSMASKAGFGCMCGHVVPPYNSAFRGYSIECHQ